MRLFIAIRLSDEMKKALVTCMHDLKKQGVEGNYVPAQNLHMTLAFLGEYNDPAKVKEVIREVSVKKPYQVHLPKADMTVKKASLMKSEQKKREDGI